MSKELLDSLFPDQDNIIANYVLLLHSKTGVYFIQYAPEKRLVEIEDTYIRGQVIQYLKNNNVAEFPIEFLEDLIAEYEYMWTTQLNMHGVIVSSNGHPEFVIKFDEDGKPYYVLIESGRLAQIAMENLIKAGAKTYSNEELEELVKPFQPSNED